MASAAPGEYRSVHPVQVCSFDRSSERPSAKKARSPCPFPFPLSSPPSAGPLVSLSSRTMALQLSNQSLTASGATTSPHSARSLPSADSCLSDLLLRRSTFPPARPNTSIQIPIFSSSDKPARFGSLQERQLAWSSLLATYPDAQVTAQIIGAIRHGVRIGYEGPLRSVGCPSRNLPMDKVGITHIRRETAQRLAEGRLTVVEDPTNLVCFCQLGLYRSLTLRSFVPSTTSRTHAAQRIMPFPWSMQAFAMSLSPCNTILSALCSSLCNRTLVAFSGKATFKMHFATS